MTGKISENYKKANQFNGSFSEKLQVFKILNRLNRNIKKVSKDGEVIEETILNYKFFSYDYWSINFLFHEIFISNDYYFESSSNEPLIIDCGTNLGMSVLYFKKLYPQSRIIAYEANPVAFELLRRNVEENELRDVEINNLALYNEDTEIPFYIGNNIRMLKGSINKERGGYKEIRIKTQKLSEVIAKYDKIDLVKMDVEGAEVNIISDLFKAGNLDKVDQYIIEYHHNLDKKSSSLSGFLKLFEENDFSYNIRTNYPKIRSFQDILIHFYKN